MLIKAPDTFLHGRVTFEKNEHYDVPDLLAGFFIGNGWAGPPDQGVTAPTATYDPADLDPEARTPERANPPGETDVVQPHDVVHEATSRIGG